MFNQKQLIRTVKLQLFKLQFKFKFNVEIWNTMKTDGQNPEETTQLRI